MDIQINKDNLDSVFKIENSTVSLNDNFLQNVSNVLNDLRKCLDLSNN